MHHALCTKIFRFTPQFINRTKYLFIYSSGGDIYVLEMGLNLTSSCEGRELMLDFDDLQWFSAQTYKYKQ